MIYFMFFPISLSFKCNSLCVRLCKLWSRIRFSSWLWLTAAILLSFSSLALTAQESDSNATAPTAVSASESSLQSVTVAPLTTDAPVELTLQSVQEFIPRIEQKQEWDAETKSRLKSIYEETATFLNVEKQWQEKITNFDKLAQSAPMTLQDVRSEIAATTTQPATNFLQNLTVAEIEPIQAQMEADLKAAQDRALEVDRDVKLRSERRLEIPKSRARVKSDLETLEQSNDLSSASDQNSEPVEKAERLKALARRRALNEELKSYDQEISSYDARRDLLVARQELATRRVTSLNNHLNRLREILSARRQKEAEEAARRAEEELKNAAYEHAAVEKLAQGNLELSRERVGEDGLVGKLNDASNDLSQLSRDLEKYLSEYRSVRGRVEAIESMGSSVNNAIGLLLRQSRSGLPEPRQYLKEIQEAQRNASASQFKLVGLREERTRYVDLESRVSEVMSEVEAGDAESGLSDFEKGFIERAAREQLQNRRKYLDDLIADYETYTSILAELEVGRLKMVELLKHFANYIDERILWIRSADRISLKDFSQDMSELKSSFSSESLRLAAGQFGNDFKNNPLPTILGVVVVIGLIALRRRLISQLKDLGIQAKKRTQVSFAITWRALWITLELAATVPVILWIIAWRLDESSYLDVNKAYAAGINALAWGYFILALLRQIIRSNGLADGHFGWNPSSLKPVRSWILVLMLVNLPILFLITVLNQRGDLSAGGRILFLISMLALGAFVFGIFYPARSPFRVNAQGEETDEFLLWTPFLLGMTCSLGLFLASAFGYHYTAMRLAGFLQYSIWLALGVYLTFKLVFRWLLLVRRKLAIEQVRQRRLAAQQAAGVAGAGAASGVVPGVNPESGVVNVTDEELDLAEANMQTVRLAGSFCWLVFALGLWGIWADIVPALGALDRVIVWPIGGGAAKAEGPGYNYDWMSDPGTAMQSDANAGSARNEDGSNGSGTSESADSLRDNQTSSSSPASMMVGGTGGGANSADAGAAVLKESSVITLADLGICLIAIFMTYIGSRNIPGLLEITAVRWMKLDRGGSYAMTTLAQYVIVLAGGLTAFGALGMTWSKLQWFAAAISLGIGFGLQEIVSNFVSGLIVLFERPIRPGDVVTVGDVSGTISKIKIRATTITDWDRKELIVPNREFVTGRLINWTLTDPVTRVVFKIGVAYGTDPEKVRDILKDIAVSTPHVLTDPAPSIVFQQFGESSLDFDLRVFVPHIDYLIATRNHIQFAIDKAFKEHGIEIPFPQRDLHIRSMPPEFLEKGKTSPIQSNPIKDAGDLEV